MLRVLLVPIVLVAFLPVAGATPIPTGCQLPTGGQTNVCVNNQVVGDLDCQDSSWGFAPTLVFVSAAGVTVGAGGYRYCSGDVRGDAVEVMVLDSNTGTYAITWHEDGTEGNMVCAINVYAHPQSIVGARVERDLPCPAPPPQEPWGEM